MGPLLLSVEDDVNEKTARRKVKISVKLLHGDWHAHCQMCGWHSVSTLRADSTSIVKGHRDQHVADILEEQWRTTA